MLKVSIIESRTQYRLVIEGKLIAPWTSELRAESTRAREVLHGRELMVDMKSLIGISQEGENVLLELMSDGVNPPGRVVFTKHVLNQLALRMRKDLRDANQ